MIIIQEYSDDLIVTTMSVNGLFNLDSTMMKVLPQFVLERTRSDQICVHSREVSIHPLFEQDMDISKVCM